jgi:hypothetical protein
MKKYFPLLAVLTLLSLSLYLISCTVVQQSGTTTTTTVPSTPTNRPSAPITRFLSLNLGDAYGLVAQTYGPAQEQPVNPGSMLVYGEPIDSANMNFYILTGEVISIMSSTSSHNICGVTEDLSESAVIGLIGSYEVKVSSSSDYYWNYPSLNISIGFSNTTHTVDHFGIYNPAKISSPPEWMSRN